MTYSCYIDPINRKNINQYTSKIESAKIVDSNRPGDAVYSNGKLTGTDVYKYIVGTYTYCNFEKETRPINWVGSFEYGEETWCTAYAGGKSLLLGLTSQLQTNKDTKFIVSDEITKIDENGKAQFNVEELKDVCSISVANITNDSYTGYGSIDNYTFCSFGNY